MAQNWYFFYQRQGKESEWKMDLAENRETVIQKLKPAFSTALDLSSVPDDNDWTKVRYRGDYYIDFDDEEDLQNAADQLKIFLGKLNDELDFDPTQARYYATGSKGFHVEIPAECFMPKVPPTGTSWLAYVYRGMSESMMVDTLDLKVYTGKKGRQWRTPNVQRENDMFKVPISFEEVMSMTRELYLELIKAPRHVAPASPPTLCTKFAMLFDRARDKITTQMRGKKKRQEKANAVLDPWKKAKKTPPTIEKIMNGESIAEGAGFQAIAMQLAIYAVSVGMDRSEFVDRCKGLCESHVSDSRRYNTPAKRREELLRMFDYFEQDTLYDFDVGPVVRLLKQGTVVTDLGVMDTEDREDTPAAKKISTVDGEEVEEETEDVNLGVRKGFFMNSQGMWRKQGDNTECISRATLRNVDAFFDAERKEFKGYEFDIFVSGKKMSRQMLTAEAFASAASMKKFFTANQLSYQGGDYETMALLDIMAEKASKGGNVYTYPREGFFILNNPEADKPEPVKVYLAKDAFKSSVKAGDPHEFRLAYRPTQAISSYDIDIHWAPELDSSMIDRLHDLFRFNRPDVVADMVGWMVAAHYRSVYLYLFRQFPMLQVYGEAGSGKTQAIMTLAHLHWYIKERISVKSASSCTSFALDSHVSSSTSAPCIIDEYKPKELRMLKGRYEKLKDVFKASYVASDVGERGTINKGAEHHLAVVKSKATAPVVFLGEAIEMETAIIERCVSVNLSKNHHTPERTKAFNRLQEDPTALSALGREIVQMGFALNLDAMRTEFTAVKAEIEARLPPMDDETRKRAAPRMVYNRAVIVHALRTLQQILGRRFGTEFDPDINSLLESKTVDSSEEARAVQMHSMSEISKTVSRIALLSREIDVPWQMQMGKDYFPGEGYVEIKVERAYDRYRRYCASIGDTPLFDNLDSFMHALAAYTPVTDRVCAQSALRDDETTERIFRLDTRRMAKEGVQSFRMV